MHADLPSPTVSEIRSLEVVPASRFPGYRPIAVVEIGRFQLGVNFRTPVSRKPSVRSASNFGSLLPWPSPFVWHRSDVDPTFGFRVGEGAPKFSTSPNSERMEISSRRLRISGRTAGPVVFAKFGDPRSIGRASFGGSKIFAFAYSAPRADDGLSPVGPFCGVGGGRSRSRPFGDAPPRLAVGSPFVVAGGGPLAPIASCGGRACNDGLLPLFLRP
jgi:hypothetical protein